jgi:hypothetical protein
MVGDPYTVGCQKTVECQINDDCPQSAKCIHENGVPKCRDACDGVKCGLNSVCLGENHAGTCQCLNGYEGNPTRSCKPIKVSCNSNYDCPTYSYCNAGDCRTACTSSLECESNEACANGQCLNLCTSEQNPCGVNGQCAMVSHSKGNN